MDYKIRKIEWQLAKDYIISNHYSHSFNPSSKPRYGLFDKNNLIGVLVFACPSSENIRRSIFGDKYRHTVIELSRLHIKDITPKNTESWFISRCLKKLHEDNPDIKAVVSFADSTVGHSGIIYRATNGLFYGMSAKATFYIDEKGRLRHPYQSGTGKIIIDGKHIINVKKEHAKKLNWNPTKRQAKYRYCWLIGDKKDKRKFKKLLKVNIQPYPKRNLND